MNRWIADVFASIVSFIHSVALLALLAIGLIVFNEKKGVYSEIMGYSFPKEIAFLLLIAAFIGYVLVMGFLSTIIAINQNIERLSAAVEKLKQG